MTRKTPSTYSLHDLISSTTSIIQSLQIPLLLFSIFLSVVALLHSNKANQLAEGANELAREANEIAYRSELPLLSIASAQSISGYFAPAPRFSGCVQTIRLVNEGGASAIVHNVSLKLVVAPDAGRIDLEPEGLEILVDSSDNAAGFRERDLPPYLDQIQFQFVDQYSHWEFPLPYDYKPQTVLSLPFSIPAHEFVDYDVLLQAIIDIEPLQQIPHIVPSYTFETGNGDLVETPPILCPLDFSNVPP